MKRYHYFDTPYGMLEILGDQKGIFSIRFEEARFPTETPSEPVKQLMEELTAYFSGKLTTFATPLHIIGTPFQKRVWQELQKIPYGETRSYQEIALALDKPTAYRAVAQANGANPLAIVIPCHRVIYKGGALGGYAGGLEQKRGLLDLEQSSFI